MFWILLLMLPGMLPGKSRRRFIGSYIVYLVVLAVAWYVIEDYFPMMIDW
jgi:hypothetical protein